MYSSKSTLTVGIIAVLTLNACRNGEQKTESTAPKDSVQTAGVSVSEAPLSSRMTTLMGTDNEATFRNVNLGDPITEVKAQEKAEVFEDVPDHVGYSLEYNNLESADILYFRDKQQKVNKINVDLYLNNRKSVEEFIQELTTYLNRRFGKESQQGGATVWTGNNTRVSLTDVSKGKDFGLKLTFVPANEPLTARQ